MDFEWSQEERKVRDAFRSFARREIAPLAQRIDRERRVPRDLIETMAGPGYWGAVVPRELGGLGSSFAEIGLMHEAIGRECSSVRSLLTAHHMVEAVILRWADPPNREVWLRRLAAGNAIGAFALSEPDVGSDAAGVQARAERVDDFFLLDGRKKWITGGQIADLFLVIAAEDGRSVALLVERESEGLEVRPIDNTLGLRGAMLAELDFKRCRVPADRLIGRPGFGFSHVAATALDLGRYCVAWGCVAIARACLEAVEDYIGRRKQFGGLLRDKPQVQQMVTRTVSELSAAQLLCAKAGFMKDRADPQAVVDTLVAKYHASVMVKGVADRAVQLHGANGYSEDYPVERYLRDAQAMEIIEGSTQILEQVIALNWMGGF